MMNHTWIMRLTILLYAGISLGLPQDPSLIGKQELFMDDFIGLMYRINQDLVPTTSYTLKQWEFGAQVPSTCFDIAVREKGCAVDALEVWDITYSDCPGVPTTVCRCNNAQVPIETIAKRIGQIPVKGRQYTRYWYILPKTGRDCDAYTDIGTNDIVLQGDCTSLYIYLHEAAHVLECGGVHAVDKVGEKGCYSHSAEWKRLVDMDTCVPQISAKKTYTETYAEAATLAAYDVNIAKIPTLGCMKNLMGKVMEHVVEKNGSPFKYVAGAVCDVHLPKDPLVCVGDAARAAGKCKDAIVPRAPAWRSRRPVLADSY
ncbi:hypothetical protein BJ508DRAFT_381304 [Ascobolus immersus RN42]|uniref:Lysine-specific metallo-endopeptidase domain-containing protein n=1 Tax=Ascobolus immersus RN42 TaxID=1160509 RepID=A0A3N4HT97_ASCIM|nr:hypothetical protein BJ508DRAFT_381304 [Ascobolus immersus RN42]